MIVIELNGRACKPFLHYLLVTKYVSFYSHHSKIEWFNTSDATFSLCMSIVSETPQYQHIDHSMDVWHVTKNIAKKLTEVSFKLMGYTFGSLGLGLLFCNLVYTIV